MWIATKSSQTISLTIIGCILK